MPGTGRQRKSVKTFTQYDYMLLFMTTGIALFGVLMIYSAGYYTASVFNAPFRFVKQQLSGLGIGFYTYVCHFKTGLPDVYPEDSREKVFIINVAYCIYNSYCAADSSIIYW